MNPYRFYAAEISYFSGKVRPALRQKGVRYVEHLPTPAAYREVIVPRTGLRFIPVVVTPDGDTWQDTSAILDAPGLLLRDRAPLVCHWIERMNHPDPTAPGAFLAGGALAPTLRPLLELVGRDAVPLLLDTLRDVERWADARPAELASPPRVAGFHATSLRGAAFQRYTSPYTLWMAQRTWDDYAALDPAGRARVDAALAGTGCEALLGYAPRHRVAKRGFELTFV